jgi:protein-tyrosine phosphatase
MTTKLYWLPTTQEFGPGRVALSPCPSAGVDAIAAQGVSVVVTLTTKEELVGVGAGDLGAQCRAVGVTHIHQPIKDYGVPLVVDAKHLVLTLRQLQRDGETILIHCMGGLGRSGLVCALWLVDAGSTPENAITIVRNTRSSKAIETKDQEQFVRDFQ